MPGPTIRTGQQNSVDYPGGRGGSPCSSWTLFRAFPAEAKDHRHMALVLNPGPLHQTNELLQYVGVPDKEVPEYGIRSKIGPGSHPDAPCFFFQIPQGTLMFSIQIPYQPCNKV